MLTFNKPSVCKSDNKQPRVRAQVQFQQDVTKKCCWCKSEKFSATNL